MNGQANIIIIIMIPYQQGEEERKTSYYWILSKWDSKMNIIPFFRFLSLLPLYHIKSFQLSVIAVCQI